MRSKMLIGMLALVALSFAQQDSTSSHHISISGGVHFTQAMFSTPALAGQLKLKYGVVELTAKYGRNRASLRNIRGFDEVNISGNWVEVGFNLVVPYDYHGKSLEGPKIGAGFGQASTAIEYRETFESLPPFQDLVYTEKYSNSGQKYFSFIMGYQLYPVPHFEVGLGVVGFYLLDQENVPLPITITPFSARSPVGLYLELSYVL